MWQKLMKTGAVIANGTDAPVEEVDPLPGYYALVTRRQKNGEVFYGDQKMTRDEALKAYTLNGAYAAFEEKTLGLADAGQARRHHGALGRHHDGARGRDPEGRGALHDRRGEGRDTRSRGWRLVARAEASG